ncbi:hypothetical protein NIES2119_05070 [[Phormidium ambiguum] IAM M-71]|uniref:Uncharacterized protein n=1 Tax=[Phormidium ambiguum] IAM M-71 TaxID=454136 RepID=A0A1U7IQF3_9CYAN|nr:hypothetical protein [Phormidium ambiguum]OKH39644.1 hypothetical protein NIES2119_05070 [Phormidium ambiguum IAM M-71]
MSSQTFLSQTKTANSRVSIDRSFNNHVNYLEKDEFSSELNTKAKSIFHAQDKIWQYFLTLVKSAAPEMVLAEFENLFINPNFSANNEIEKALQTIILYKNEQEFRNTIKRCIYILLNTWIYSRKYQYTQILIEKLSIQHLSYRGSSTFLRGLRSWLINFLKSQDYEEVKVVASKYDDKETKNWKSRYTSYLLTPQYLNSHNSVEQRQAARRLSQQLQDKYKFDLAMFTAHSHTHPSPNDKVKNPTALGNEALRLIKNLLAKQGFFNYVNLAHIFLSQTEQLEYETFKKSLLNYLIFSVENASLVESIKMQLTQKLDLLYQHENRQPLRNGLILRTSNRMIEYLTIGNNNKPSDLFVLIASQGNPLTLAILILKVILISPPSRTYLELSISKLIDYYGNYSEEDCQWVINFLEVTKMILTMYTENVKYNLVNMEKKKLQTRRTIEENVYRIFSQSQDEDK